MNANKRLIFFCLIAFILLHLDPSHSADDGKIVLRKEIEKQKHALKEISKQISTKRKKLVAIKDEEKRLLDAIQRLNQKIVYQWNLLQEKKKARREIEAKIKAISRSIKELENTLKRQQKFIELRLRALWEFGTLGVLNVVFSSKSLDELYSRQQYLLFILQKDRAMRDAFLKNLTKLKKKKESLDHEKELLIKVEREIETTAIKLEETKETKRIFLEDLKGQEESYRRLLSSLQATESGISKLIERLKREASHKKKPSHHTSTSEGKGQKAPQRAITFESKIVENIGKLTPPILNAYMIVTSERDPRVPKNGIILESPMGAPVRAIFDGTIKYVGKVKGYGTVVIIDHGSGYMSLLGYLARAFVKPGQKVFEGEAIGLAGPGGLVDSGTYLEIRKDGKPVSALKFLDTRGMIIE